MKASSLQWLLLLLSFTRRLLVASQPGNRVALATSNSLRPSAAGRPAVTSSSFHCVYAVYVLLAHPFTFLGPRNVEVVECRRPFAALRVTDAPDCPAGSELLAFLALEASARAERSPGAGRIPEIGQVFVWRNQCNHMLCGRRATCRRRPEEGERILLGVSGASTALR